MKKGILVGLACLGLLAALAAPAFADSSPLSGVTGSTVNVPTVGGLLGAGASSSKANPATSASTGSSTAQGQTVGSGPQANGAATTFNANGTPSSSASALAAVLSLASLLGDPGASQGPQGNGASTPLVHFKNPFCNGRPFVPGTTVNGVVTIKETGNHQLIAEVTLKNALPNTTYNVRLIQTPSGSDCFVVDTTLTTNAQGNGNANVMEAELPGTTGAFVAVNFPDFSGDFYSTDNVLFR